MGPLRSRLRPLAEILSMRFERALLLGQLQSGGHTTMETDCQACPTQSSAAAEGGGGE